MIPIALADNCPLIGRALSALFRKRKAYRSDSHYPRPPNLRPRHERLRSLERPRCVPNGGAPEQCGSFKGLKREG